MKQGMSKTKTQKFQHKILVISSTVTSSSGNGDHYPILYILIHLSMLCQWMEGGGGRAWKVWLYKPSDPEGETCSWSDKPNDPEEETVVVDLTNQAILRERLLFLTWQSNRLWGRDCCCSFDKPSDPEGKLLINLVSSNFCIFSRRLRPLIMDYSSPSCSVPHCQLCVSPCSKSYCFFPCLLTPPSFSWPSPLAVYPQVATLGWYLVYSLVTSVERGFAIFTIFHVLDNWCFLFLTLISLSFNLNLVYI